MYWSDVHCHSKYMVCTVDVNVMFLISVIIIMLVFYLLQTIALTFIFFLLWTIYGFLASGVVVIYVELMLSCNKLEATAGPLGLNNPHLCLPLATGLSELLLDKILLFLIVQTVGWLVLVDGDELIT